MKLKGQLLSFTILPVIITGIVILIITGSKIRSSYMEERKFGLNATAETALELYSANSAAPYEERNGELWRGDDFNIKDTEAMLERIKVKTGMDFTFFYKDTRTVTTAVDEQGKKAIGSKASDIIVKTVLQGGKTYFGDGVDVQGRDYYGYYLPVTQPGTQEVIGIFFAGYPSANSSQQMWELLFVLLSTVVIMAIICTIISICITAKICNALNINNLALSKIAEGELGAILDEDILERRDEIGDIAKGTESLRINLIKIITSIKTIGNALVGAAENLDDMAVQTTSTTDQVERAINEIALGASSQASETQKASEEVTVMGKMIQQTEEEVERLTEKATEMNGMSQEAAGILEKLKEVTERAKEAIIIINSQTNTTNESAIKIKEATEIITSIADETNLLSLNASIEAARAGEQGRGFAVVASQIQKLAEQSNESARIIASIVNTLIADANKAVGTMNEVTGIMNIQVSQVDATEKIFHEVRKGISVSIEGVGNIAVKTEGLGTARISVVDAVQNLTAIAEENAAGTEQTLAATEEVATSIGTVAALSSQLRALSSQLEEEINIFNLNILEEMAEEN